MYLKRNITISGMKRWLVEECVLGGLEPGLGRLGFLGPWVGLELIKMQEEVLVGFAEPGRHLFLM